MKYKLATFLLAGGLILTGCGLTYNNTAPLLKRDFQGFIDFPCADKEICSDETYRDPANDDVEGWPIYWGMKWNRQREKCQFISIQYQGDLTDPGAVVEVLGEAPLWECGIGDTYDNLQSEIEALKATIEEQNKILDGYPYDGTCGN